MKEEEPFTPDPADEQAFRVAYLVAGFIRNTLDGSEHAELDSWVNASWENRRLFEKLIDEKYQDEWLKQIGSFDTEARLKKIKSRMTFTSPAKKSRVRSMWPYVAAASVVILLAIALLVTKTPKSTQDQPMVQLPAGDIAPGKNQATLTLSDGTKIMLDTVQIGRVVAQNNSHITKLDSGQLVYASINPTLMPQTDIFNTLSVPAGGQYKVVLPDGTKVWLNASSTLKYPIVFGGAKRKVELTGEGYFEVAKDPMYPFEVIANNATVQVLGTHFNVNAYPDEPGTTVSLAEGAIRLNNAIVLRPGEEGKVGKNGNVEKGKADLDVTLAWKEGRFLFKDASIDVLMRQVARWYSARIVYDTKLSDHFNAEIPRDVPVTKLLHLLEATGSVHFKIENNTITVMK